MYHYNKEIPISAEYDVIVAGSGPSGICAAVSAARLGKKVAVIERYGVLGGNLTIGSVGPIMGCVAEGGMRDELTGLLGVQHNDMQAQKGHVHDINASKRKILDLLVKENVTIYMQAPVIDVVKERDAVNGVILSEKEGMSVILGKRVVDATGDGDLAVYAGAEYRMGRDSDGLLQPVTLMYVLTGVNEERAITCIGEEDNVQYKGERFLDFTERCANERIIPPQCKSVRLYKTLTPGERLVNTTQVNYVNPLNSRDIVKSEIELRHQIDEITEFLRKNVEGFENCWVKSTADTLGVRESRRIMGDYVLDVDDLRAGRRFEDVVVHKANFVVDIHNPDGGGQANGLAEVVHPYDIPYRCLLPKYIENLIVTGRCISATHEALASYRIMSVCMALGEAAGIAAALSIDEDTSLRKLDYKLIQKELTIRGADLFSE